MTAVALYGSPVVIGIIIGRMLGGKAEGLVAAGKAPWLLYAAAAAQLGQLLLGVHAPIAACFGAVWLVVNFLNATGGVRAALLTIGTGAAANGAAILANGRMPYASSEGTAAQSEGVHLAWLTDVLPVTPLHAMVSAGDIVLAVGVGGWVVVAMGAVRGEGVRRPLRARRVSASPG